MPDVIVTQCGDWQRHVRENVCIDHDKRFTAEKWQRALNAASGFQDVIALVAVNDIESVS
jgi:hypothetical protein